MAKPDIRDWSFAKQALYELRLQPKKHKKHYHRREYYWVHVQFTSGKIANYQLPRDLQEPLDQHRRAHPGIWKDILLGALINVPTTKYRDGEAKICPAVIREILILPVGAHNPRWITRSQFVKPNYSYLGWLFNQADMKRENNFLTHDFDETNKQRIEATLEQYCKQQVHRARKKFWQCLLIVFLVMFIAGVLIWI